MIYDIIPEARWQEFRDAMHAADHGFLDRREYRERVAELTGMTVAEVARLDERQHVRDESMIDEVRRLKSSHKIGLLSNIDSESIYRMFTASELSELFDTVVLSAEVGIVKPTVEIFELAAARLGVAPEECVMIDDLEKNIVGAELAGMKAIHFTTKLAYDKRIAELLDA